VAFCALDEGLQPGANSPLHDIVITNIVWCMTYKGTVWGSLYLAHKSRNSIAVVWVMRMGGVIKGWLILAHTRTSTRISCIGQGANSEPRLLGLRHRDLLLRNDLPPPTVSRVWVTAVSAARRVSLRRALLVARVSNDYPSGSSRVFVNSPDGV